MKKPAVSPRAWPAATTVALLAIAMLASASVANNTYQVPKFAQDWSNTALITTNDDWSGVPGIIGYLGDSDAGAPTNVDPRTLTADVVTVAVDVNANRTDANTFISGGVSEFEGGVGVRGNPVVALQGSGTADAPFLKLHLDASNMSSVTVSYTLVDVDSSADNAVQQSNAQYRIGSSGPWTNLAGTYFADVTDGPTISGRTTPVSVTLPPDVAKQPQVEIRIMTTNAGGNDEWVGIDDIRMDGVANVNDIAITSLCATDSTKACSPVVFTQQPWHSLFTVANLGNKAINNWSFDIALVHLGSGQQIPIKTQVPGPPIAVGQAIPINWPSPYIFASDQKGPWLLNVAVQIKEPGNPDTSQGNNALSYPFVVENKGQIVSDLAVDSVCTTDSTKQCTSTVFTNQPWHILFSVSNRGNKVIDNWSFDIVLVDSSQARPDIPLKVQVAGPPLPPGGPPIAINWPSPYIFSSAEKGEWAVVVRTTVKDPGNPDANPSNNTGSATFTVANKGDSTVSDLAIVFVCATDSTKQCTSTVFTNQPWHILFAVANVGNKVIDNWSFDILLQDSLTGQTLPLKTQVAGPPLAPGPGTLINWPSPLIFTTAQKGQWTVVVRGTVKDPGNPDANPSNNALSDTFTVANKSGEVSDLAVDFVCATDSTKQCTYNVFTQQPWHILFNVTNLGNKVIDNWSFDIVLLDSLPGQPAVIPIKVQVPGPPIAPGNSMTINWPSPYIFSSDQKGQWTVVVRTTVKDPGNPDSNPTNDSRAWTFTVVNKGGGEVSDLVLLLACATDTTKLCTGAVFTEQPWHILFAVANYGNKVIDNWSFDIVLHDSLSGQTIPLKTQVAGPPLPPGPNPTLINWPSPYVFTSAQKGPWFVEIRGTVKDPGNPDANPSNNATTATFNVTNKGGGQVSDIGVHNTCVTDSTKQCTQKVFFGAIWHTLFTVVNKGQKAVDNWSFDITLVKQDSTGQVIPVKTQIAGPPLPVGGTVTLNWPGPGFGPGDQGIWQVIVTVVVKDPGNPDTSLVNNRDTTTFEVNPGIVATLLSLFDAEPDDEGLLLRWRFVDPDAFTEVGLERGAAASGPWSPIGAERRYEEGATVVLDRGAELGRTYYYRLVARQPDGQVFIFGPLAGMRGGPNAGFALSRVSPNPSFGPTKVDFSLPRDAFVRLSVTDVLGREVAKLVEGRYRAGTHQATWSGQTTRGSASPGLYFVCLKTPDGTMVRRFALTR